MAIVLGVYWCHEYEQCLISLTDCNSSSSTNGLSFRQYLFLWRRLNLLPEGWAVPKVVQCLWGIRIFNCTANKPISIRFYVTFHWVVGARLNPKVLGQWNQYWLYKTAIPTWNIIVTYLLYGYKIYLRREKYNL